MASNEIYQTVTDQIIAQLEAGTRPWTRPWIGGTGLPRRHTGERYKGVNLILLWMAAEAKGYRNSTWMTYKQAKGLGAYARKGEEHTDVCFASTFQKKETDAAGDEKLKSIPFLKTYQVFNVEQIDGLPEGYGTPAAAPINALDDSQRIESVEAFYASLGAKVEYGGSVASYNTATDRIKMPDFASFSDPLRFYDMLGHEVIHWTGAANRKNRDLSGQFGGADYAKEELIAELGAAFLAAFLGTASEPRADHADYLAHWLVKLRSDKRFIFSAASAAQAALDFLVAQAEQSQEKMAEAA